MSKPTVMTIFGTRPEAIKMAPVVKELQRRFDQLDTLVVSTGQHREMLDQVTEIFEIETDVDLAVMTANQSLAAVTSRILTELDQVLEKHQPQCVLVQGDTTTAFAAALAAFYRKIPVGHVEAGLRTGDRYNPFPEEMNRVLAGRLAEFHFAPTRSAEKALLAEGIPPSAITVTGNTVIDALQWVVEHTIDHNKADHDGSRFRILVTAHRRENLGAPMREICEAILELVRSDPRVEVIFPVHLNPNVRACVFPLLESVPRVRLMEPLSYLEFVGELARCDLILTDSGGIQEEAPSLGKPVLVMRHETERMEGVEAGTCRLVGPCRENIVREAKRLIGSEEAYREMATAANPYGDGKAAERIVQFLIERLTTSICHAHG